MTVKELEKVLASVMIRQDALEKEIEQLKKALLKVAHGIPL